MRYLVLFLMISLSLIAADDHAYLVNPATGVVTDIVDNTPVNLASLQERLLTDRVGWEIRTSKVDFDILTKADFVKAEGAGVVEDTAKQSAKDFEVTVQEQIEVKQRLLAINDLLKTATGVTATELTKQKAKLEAKIS